MIWFVVGVALGAANTVRQQGAAAVLQSDHFAPMIIFSAGMGALCFSSILWLVAAAFLT